MLSSISSHLGLLGFLKVKIKQTIISKIAIESVIIGLSYEYIVMTVYIPPIQIMKIPTGRRYLTINSHPLPIFIDFILNLKNQLDFQLYISSQLECIQELCRTVLLSD